MPALFLSQVIGGSLNHKTIFPIKNIFAIFRCTRVIPMPALFLSQVIGASLAHKTNFQVKDTKVMFYIYLFCSRIYNCFLFILSSLHFSHPFDKCVSERSTHSPT
ncbi:uncharacterized protein [Bemisia tabaci]|uniref:uncharacterized protein n=1 Tax=Bemisia tabaci TaxID=7038 RepID=UPI003B285494